MATNLGSIRTFVRNQTLVESDDMTNADLNLLINAGLNEMSLAFDWPFLHATSNITTVQDQANYDLPADLRRLFAVRDNDRRATVTRIDMHTALNRWGGDPPSGDNAHWYYLWNDDIWLIPVPDTAEASEYTLFYQKAITELSADGDTPEFVSEFHLTPAYYAIARVWEHEEDFTKAEASENAFRQRVEQMARFYHQTADKHPLVFGNGPRPALNTAQNMPWLDGA